MEGGFFSPAKVHDSGVEVKRDDVTPRQVLGDVADVPTADVPGDVDRAYHRIVSTNHFPTNGVTKHSTSHGALTVC